MPTRKVRDLTPEERCTSREHDPPGHMVYSPGIYEHTCPACGKKQTFRVDGVRWGGWRDVKIEGRLLGS